MSETTIPGETGTAQRLGELLGRLPGQWIEAVDALDGELRSLVTSRGWVIRGSALSIPAFAPVSRDDARVRGLLIAAIGAQPSGDLVMSCVAQDGERVDVVAPAPWAILGERGAAAAARDDGALGVHPETGPLFATPEAMAAWEATEPTPLELELLRRAEDDWISPADVVGALIEAGVDAPADIAEQGIAALARLMARGDLVAGGMTDAGFDPSTRGTAEDIELVAGTWRALADRLPAAGQIAWFDLTERGAERIAGDGR